MQKSRKVFLTILAATLGLLVTAWLVSRWGHPMVLKGVVTRRDADVGKELPIAGVEVTTPNDAAAPPTKSDASGLFILRLRKWAGKGHHVVLEFRHPNYEPLDLTEIGDNRLYVVRMVPLTRKSEDPSAVTVSNVRVRYSIKASRAVNVGSTVKTFQVVNTGNIPCDHQTPCSPDGKWRAALGSITLDAGPGNQFQNTRVSCIAGPCPFTRIESGDFSQPSQKIAVEARNWSDTTTFLIEAEVTHVLQTNDDHQSYPVIFGSALDFTLPAGAEGVTFEADVDGESIFFPLGPSLFLSWARCSSTPSRQETTYRCELKPGYRFQ